MDNGYESEATGSGTDGVDLSGHVTGDPIRQGGRGGSATRGHTFLIVAVALLLLWLFGGKLFKSVRM